MTTHIARLADLAARVGDELATSDWITIDQTRIDRFADATATGSGFTSTGPRCGRPFWHHGGAWFLTLSLLPWFFRARLRRRRRAHGPQLRPEQGALPGAGAGGQPAARALQAAGYEPLEGGAQLVIEATIERDVPTSRSAWPSP